MSILILFAIIIAVSFIGIYGSETNNKALEIIGIILSIVCFAAGCIMITVSMFNPVKNNDGETNTYAVHEYILDSNGYCVSYFTSDTEINMYTTTDVILDENINSPIIVITTEGTVNAVYKVFFPWTALMDNSITEATLYLPQEVVK